MQNKKVFIFIVEHEYLEPKVKSTKKVMSLGNTKFTE